VVHVTFGATFPDGRSRGKGSKRWIDVAHALFVSSSPQHTYYLPTRTHTNENVRRYLC